MTIAKYILVFLTAVVILIALIVGLKSCNPTPNPTTITVHDTIIVYRTIYIDTIPAKVIYRPYVKYVSVPEYYLKDTVIRDTTWLTTMPFEACFDTIINKDTISGEFYFPEFQFRHILIRLKPDTIIHDITTIQLPATFGQKMEYGFYSGIIGILGGGVLGYIVGTKP